MHHAFVGKMATKACKSKSVFRQSGHNELHAPALILPKEDMWAERQQQCAAQVQAPASTLATLQGASVAGSRYTPEPTMLPTTREISVH
jgi:hypothetical protein